MESLISNQYLIKRYTQKQTSNSKIHLNAAQNLRHTIYSKIKRVVIPSNSGNTAITQGGFFMPVTFGGLVECMQKYKTSFEGNRHIVFLFERLRHSAAFAQRKKSNRTIKMIASLPFVGALRPMAARTRLRTVKKKELAQTLNHSPITFKTYADGNTVAFQNARPIAWIVQGIHHGQVDNQPYTCTYYDVAFIQQSRHTYFLDPSPEFDTEQQARDFITVHFKAEVAA